jgi:hypothetical protein
MNAKNKQDMINLYDRWLFDTGGSIHTINDKKWYIPGIWRKLTAAESDNTASITANGLTYPTAVGRAIICLEGYNGKPVTIICKVAILYETYPLNIFSGERFYLYGGFLARNLLVQDGIPIARLDIRKRSFFLLIFGSGDDYTTRQALHTTASQSDTATANQFTNITDEVINGTNRITDIIDEVTEVDANATDANNL